MAHRSLRQLCQHLGAAQYLGNLHRTLEVTYAVLVKFFLLGSEVYGVDTLFGSETAYL